jgi:hypothetical protein
MSERFLFMPSVGFVLVLAYFIMKLPQKFAFGVSIVVLLLFSVKTFTRNRVWENDFTLFTTDVKTSISFLSSQLLSKLVEIYPRK